VGERRVGVAVASLIARYPSPLTTLERTAEFAEHLADIIDAESPAALVIGLPRGLEGQRTAQTDQTERFAEDLRQAYGLPIYFQDEALTSRKAETELEARGKAYKKADIDALAATYILEDFLTDNPQLDEVG
jgi:putative Holliday junction resolvase